MKLSKILAPLLALCLFASTACASTFIDAHGNEIQLDDSLEAYAAVTLVGAIGYHLWARVTVSDHEIVTRSLTRGVTRIRRSEVLEIRECAGRGWFLGRTVTQLGVLVAANLAAT